MLNFQHIMRGNQMSVNGPEGNVTILPYPDYILKNRTPNHFICVCYYIAELI